MFSKFSWEPIECMKKFLTCGDDLRKICHTKKIVEANPFKNGLNENVLKAFPP